MSKNDKHDEDKSVSVIDYTLKVFDSSFVSESQQLRQIYFSMLHLSSSLNELLKSLLFLPSLKSN